MPNAVRYAKLKDAGFIRNGVHFCRRCGTHPALDGYTRCHLCRPDDLLSSSRQADRIEARISTRSIMPEWKIREIEKNQEEARERKERLG